MSTFDWRTGEPTVFASAKERQFAARRQVQTAHVEMMRGLGVDIGAVPGMSRKSDERSAELKRSHKGKKATP